jgi:hypothetical protein
MPTARKGKIASLPARIREEVNRRLLDGETAPQIIKWLSSEPDVARVLEERWKGEAVSDNNISQWREGGYEDWKKQNERIEAIKTLSDYSFKLARAAGRSLSEGATAIAGGRILELLETVADRAQTGEANVVSLENEDSTREMPFEFDLEKLVNSVATLSHVEVARQRETRQGRGLELDIQRFRRQTAEIFISWHADKRAREILEGKGTKEVKMDNLVTLMFGERPSDAHRGVGPSGPEAGLAVAEP